MLNKLFSSIMVWLMFISGSGWAANYSNPVDGVFRGAYGNTISVEVPTMVSKSPYTSDNENGDLTFLLNPDTGYRNFNQLTDLKYGDPLRVEYSLNPKDKRMVAQIITKLDEQEVTNPIVVSTNNNPAQNPATQTVTTTTTTRINTP